MLPNYNTNNYSDNKKTMETRASIKVSGIVQGVYFRYSTKQKADQLGLTGTVRNLIDGSVAIVCEGEEKDVNALIDWSKQGPPGARVDTAEVVRETATGTFKTFSVIY